MIIQIKVNTLKRLWSPFESSRRPWSLQKNCPISIRNVQQAVANRELVGNDRTEHYGKDVRALHIKRIAWFVVNGIARPISIYIRPFFKELTNQSHWSISDGNHRLAAAIVRGDEFIRSSLSGDLEYAEKLLDLDFGSPDGVKYNGK